MKRFIAVLSLLAVTMSAGCFARAQSDHPTGTIHVRMAIAGMGQAAGIPSYCTVANPCLELNWTNPSGIAATIATAVVSTPAGAETVETAGPANAVVERCTVTTSQSCTVTAGVPAAPAAWTAVPAQNGGMASAQTVSETTSAGGPFFDNTVAYGATYAYSATLTWTGSLGGVASAYAPPFQYTFAAPANTPGAPASPSGITVVPII